MLQSLPQKAPHIANYGVCKRREIPSAQLEAQIKQLFISYEHLYLGFLYLGKFNFDGLGLLLDCFEYFGIVKRLVMLREKLFLEILGEYGIKLSTSDFLVMEVRQLLVLLLCIHSCPENRHFARAASKVKNKNIFLL